MKFLKRMFSKTILLNICLWLCIATALSQTYTHVYYMNESFESVKKDNGVFVCKGYQTSEGFKLDCFTLTTDSLALSCYFTDFSLATLQGAYQQYHPGNILQSKGFYQNNQKHGVWEDWDQQGRKTDSVVYENGVRVGNSHYNYIKDKATEKAWIADYEMKDSLADTFDKYYFSDNGTLLSKVHFLGNNGVLENYLDGKTVIDTVFSREEKAPEFPGGTKGWTRFVQTALGSFNPADHGADNGKWQVIVKFTVDIDGSISDVKAETKFGHKMEETVIKFISQGPKWIPANRFGKLVKFYRRQPVTFIVSGL